MAQTRLHWPRWFAVFAMVVTAAACSKQGGVSPESPDQAAPQITIRVANLNASDATIFLLIRGSGNAHRIGSVTAFDEARLAIPRPYERQDIRFTVRLFGSGDEYTTEEVYAADIGFYTLTVGPELRMTNLVAR